MAEVEFRQVTKQFPGGVTALRSFDLHVRDGEFLILVGPSGCGKTTALRLLAGLDKPTGGELRIDDDLVNNHGPGDRDIAMVFQNYALYPHMSVYKNLAYGLRQRKTPKAEVERRVRAMSNSLGLDDMLRRKPAQLSGGQRQRVAMGRALVREPRVFLLDEPLSNLDAKLRAQVRGEIKRLHRRLGVTSIYVTHDQVEAMTLGERICVIDNGVIQQVGTPQEVYDAPANAFVAGFLGSPAMNLLRVAVTAGQAMLGGCPVAAAQPGLTEVTVGIRPEALQITGDQADGIHMVVDYHEPLGSHVLVYGTVDGSEVVVDAGLAVRPEPGTVLSLAVTPGAAYLFDAATGAALPRTGP
jgi:sn-glycerol 3-phosphate transport system ATP-binding protein